MGILDKEYSTCRNVLLVLFCFFLLLAYSGESQPHFQLNAKTLHEYLFPAFFWMSALGIDLEISIPQQHLYMSVILVTTLSTQSC